MSPFVLAVSHILSIATLGGQIIIVALVVSFLFFRNQTAPVFALISKNFIQLAFLVALGATLGSLFYSEIARFVPCELCWYNRIFLFSQVVLFSVALFKKDARVADYSIVFSAVGFSASAYQSLLQWGAGLPIPCSVAATSVSCAKVYFTEFGYITIPVMAATAFALLIALCIIGKKKIESR